MVAAEDEQQQPPPPPHPSRARGGSVTPKQRNGQRRRWGDLLGIATTSRSASATSTTVENDDSLVLDASQQQQSPMTPDTGVAVSSAQHDDSSPMDDVQGLVQAQQQRASSSSSSRTRSRREQEEPQTGEGWGRTSATAASSSSSKSNVNNKQGSTSPSPRIRRRNAPGTNHHTAGNTHSSEATTTSTTTNNNTKPLEDLSEGAQPPVISSQHQDQERPREQFSGAQQQQQQASILASSFWTVPVPSSSSSSRTSEDSSSSSSVEKDQSGPLNDTVRAESPRGIVEKGRLPQRRNQSANSVTTASMPSLSPCSSFNSKDFEFFDSLEEDDGESTQRTKSSTTSRRSMPSLASYSSSSMTSGAGTTTNSNLLHNHKQQQQSYEEEQEQERHETHSSSLTSMSIDLDEPQQQPASELTLMGTSYSSLEGIQHDSDTHTKAEQQEPSSSIQERPTPSSSQTTTSSITTARSMPSLASLSSSDVSSSSETRRSSCSQSRKNQADGRSANKGSTISSTIREEKKQTVLVEDGGGRSPIGSELSSSGRTKSQYASSSLSPPELTSSSSDSQGHRNNYSTTSSSSPEILAADSKTMVSSHSSSLPSGKNIMLRSPSNNSKAGIRSVASSPADSLHSTTSLLGQNLINEAPELDSWDSFNAGSMAYSETSHTTTEDRENTSVSSAKDSVGTAGSSKKKKTSSSSPRSKSSPKQTRGRRNSTGAPSGDASASSTVSSKSRSLHSLTKKEPSPAGVPYDGVLLYLVDSMHGSGSTTTENFNDSMSSFHTSSHSLHTSRPGVGSLASVSTSGSKHSRRSGHAMRSVQAPLLCAEDYVSSASSASSFGNEDASSTISGQEHKTTIEAQKSPKASSRSQKTGKAPRRQSGGSNMSSEESSSVKKSEGGRHPPHKQRRRHSLGTPPAPSASPPSPGRRRSAGRDNSSGISNRHNEPTPKQGNSLGQYIARQMERGDSGYFSGASSQERHESRSLGSPMGSSRSRKSLDSQSDETVSLGSPIMASSRSRKTIDRVEIPRSPVYHRGVRSASPLPQASRKLSTADLKQSRFSAPPRLGRIRSPRRRIIHIANHIESEKLNASLGSASGSRFSSHSQRSVASLSIRDLEGGQGSQRSLPPLSPGQLRSPLGKPPIDPTKAKTVRHGNRTADSNPEIADIKQGRRRSWNNSSSERRYRIVGLPPFVEDNEDSSVSSGSISDDSSQDGGYSRFKGRESMSQLSNADSLGRMSWVHDDSFSSHNTLQPDEGPLPPRHRHHLMTRPSLRTIPSEASVSSFSEATPGMEDLSHLDQSPGRNVENGEKVDIEPLSRIDKEFTISLKKEEEMADEFISDDLPPSSSQVIFGTGLVRISSVVSAASAVSNTSYDLQPVHLVIPGSPEEPSMMIHAEGSPLAESASSKSSMGEESSQLLPAPPLYDDSSSHTDPEPMDSVLNSQLKAFVEMHGQLRDDSSASSASSAASSHDRFDENTRKPRSHESSSRFSTTSSKYEVSSDASDDLFEVPGALELGNDSSGSSSSTTTEFEVSSEPSSSVFLEVPTNQLQYDSSVVPSSSSSSRPPSSKDEDFRMEWFPAQKQHQQEQSALCSPRKLAISPPNSPFASRHPRWVAKDERTNQELEQKAVLLTSSSVSASSSPASQAIWDKLTLEKERQQKLREKLRGASPIPMIHTNSRTQQTE